jgi:hypothetical protein
MFAHFWTLLCERIAETSYWLAVIICSCSMILYAASEARIFRTTCTVTIVSYVLLKGILEVLY